MKDNEVYRVIKPVDLAPVLPIIDKLEFADSGGVCAWVTKPGSQMPPELLTLIRSLGLDGEYKRVFCRKLMPHQGIAPHIDEWMAKEDGWRRFQLPLTSHPDIKMRWPDDGIELHLAPGFLYEVRYNRTHEVVNDTDASRIHVQIDMANCSI